MIRLEPRGHDSQAMAIAAPLIAVAATLVSGLVMFQLLGIDGPRALYYFFIDPLTTVYGLGEWLVKAGPLIIIACGLALGFRANVWNIGAEGQFILGALAASAMALAFWDEEHIWLMPAMMAAGAAGGALWAAIPAFCRTRFNASEILVSLMLVYVAELLLSYLVHGPLRDPDGFNFPESRMFHDSAVLAPLVEGTRIHFGAVIALLAVALSWLVLARTVTGYQIKVIGFAPRAGAYAGFSQKRMVWIAMCTTGALAGLAGACEVAGPIGQLQPSVSPGYGFTAIIVAFLGRLHPVGILLAGLLMALSFLGGEAVQIQMGLPLAMTGVFQGMLLFFVLAADVLIRYRVRFAARVTA